MAERRMFSKSVVESARFLKMPASSQNLYFHLGMNADDDGVVEGYSVINLVKAHEDDLRVLYSKGFVRILNEDLVTYIADWREQNKIRPDRKKDSMYKNLLLQMEPDVELLEKKDRSDLVKKSGRSMDGEMSAQCSVVEVSLGQGSIGECSATSDKNTHTKYQLDNEVLTVADYESLIKQHSKAVVDGVIGRILSKPYHGCLNMAKISAWCAEQSVMSPAGKNDNKESRHSDQLKRLASERIGD